MPELKTAVMASLFFKVIFKGETSTIGSSRIRQSETMLMPEGAMRRTLVETHLPDTVLSQILRRGTHWKISTQK